MRPVVGLPSTLFYFTDAPLWETFLENLGFQVATSPPTNKQILDDGIRVTVTDACVPIKIYHGHAIALKDKVDYLFIPRYVSLEKGETFCPKFLGLPDMIKSSIPGLPEIIAPEIELKKPFSWLRLCRELAEATGSSLVNVARALGKAFRVQKQYKRILQLGYLPQEGMRLLKKKILPSKPKNNQDLQIAVLGYPYQIHDPYVNVNLLEHLKNLGVHIWTIEMLTENMLRPYRNIMPKNHFWHFSNRVMWSLYYCIHKIKLDGVIHVTAFACGPDAMVDKFMELELKDKKVPFISLTIDEHSAEAGVITRLEAFVDMIRHRRQTQ